jgi:ADP-ribose pyrophosphatase YjhB (NUDIX family)
LSRLYPDRPHAGVLAVVRREGRVLLVERARPPNEGKWGFPGGGQELGERFFTTATRELREETGIEARPVDVLTVLDVIGRDDDRRVRWHWMLVVVLLDFVAGDAAPLDEATAVGWFDLAGLRAARLVLMPDVERLVAAALAHPLSTQPAASR